MLVPHQRSIIAARNISSDFPAAYLITMMRLVAACDPVLTPEVRKPHSTRQHDLQSGAAVADGLR